MTTLQDLQPILKRTPLYERHVSLNGKMVDFNGWCLPVYYTGIIAEHQWVRSSCGFFDVSHLGEFRVHGPGATALLQKRLTNDVRKCQRHHILYSVLCDGQGRTLDDILIYRESENDYFLIVNAGNIDRDLEELKRYEKDVPDVVIENDSDRLACIAVQGPKAETILESLFGFKLASMGYYTFKEDVWKGQDVWISRSGYTGEDGFEIFSNGGLSVQIWDRLVEDGKALGAQPAGLGARNTLRLEAGNGLYGNELTTDTTPLEAGLGFVVSWDKGDFVGRAALEKQKKEGVLRRLVCFKMLDRAVAREHYPIFKDGRKIGEVTSGSFAPSVGGNIGMAYVAVGQEAVGNVLEIEIHGRLMKAEIVRRPFVALKHRKN